MSTMTVLDADSLGSHSSGSGQGNHMCNTATLRGCAYKTVRLRRGISRHPFGFSFRGGREFGTGFFISVVEPGSEADRKGLQIGDQIIRINGLSVDDATHHEVVQLAQQNQTLTLTLNSVGLIPVKEKNEGPLTWKFVDYDSGQPPGQIHDYLTSGCDVDRIVIETSEKTKLGCGICKGPEWRPGIFVQYTKPNSLARKSGLQPGDQILQCNRVSFIDIDFSYAVSVLKSSELLDLVIRKGSGIDLFPGESSGYSSSSSTTDDPVKYTTNNSVPKKMENRVPPPPRLPTTKLTTKSERTTNSSNEKSLDQLNGPQMLTVRQECRFGNQTVVQITGVSSNVDNILDNGDSHSSLSSSASLSSAISQEIQRRNEKRSRAESNEAIVKPVQKPTEPKRQQHDLLIAELKKRQDSSSTLVSATSPRKSNAGKPLAPPPPAVTTTPPSPSPPQCPTPDYSDSSSITNSPPAPPPPPPPNQLVKSSIKKFEERSRVKSVTFGGSSTKEITPVKSNMDSVDMISMDCNELATPKAAVPKPPHTYFNQPTKTSNNNRTTVITITEYPTDNKRNPSKFEFLTDKSTIENTFDNELAQTLTRSNFRNKAEGNSETNSRIVSTKSRAPPPPSQPVPQVIPLQSELSHVKKTLKTFERNTGTNTIIVKIPKRN